VRTAHGTETREYAQVQSLELTAMRGALAKWLTGAMALTAASSASASGGEHVIDDATVETPGGCHVESWVSLYGHGRGLLNLSPACTPRKIPRLEIGWALQHSWDSGSLTTVGPSLKLNIRPAEAGIGLALSASGLVDVKSGKIAAASLIAPLTIPIVDGVAVNLNGGLSYSLASSRHYAPFYGGQVQVQFARDLSWIVEAFQRAHSPVGAQTGVRWSPGGGNVDFDIVLGRYIDGVNQHAISFGVTLRS